MGLTAAPSDITEDARRSERLQAYSILDSPREQVFDRFVFTAAQMFRVPIALLSLASTDRFWLKASVGLEPDQVELTQAFYAHMSPDSVLAVEDARMDARFANASIVTGPPFARFYAGAPLVTPDGLLVGSLCVIDRFPKTLLSRQIWQLSQLAHSVVTALEARRAG